LKIRRARVRRFGSSLSQNATLYRRHVLIPRSRAQLLSSAVGTRELSAKHADALLVRTAHFILGTSEQRRPFMRVVFRTDFIIAKRGCRNCGFEFRTRSVEDTLRTTWRSSNLMMASTTPLDMRRLARLRALRRILTWVLALALSAPFLVVMLSALLEHLGKAGPVVGSPVGLGWAIVTFVLLASVMGFRCPRCSSAFHGERGNRNLFSDSCIKCGLKL